MRILGIVGSPRKNGNTEILMKEALRMARDAGCETEMFLMSEKQVAPCDACGTCFDVGSCVVQDDMQELYDMMERADGIIIGSPVYFGSVSAQTKAIMDRMFALLGRRALKDKIAGALVGYQEGRRYPGAFPLIHVLHCPGNDRCRRRHRLRKRNGRRIDRSRRWNRHVRNGGSPPARHECSQTGPAVGAERLTIDD